MKKKNFNSQADALAYLIKRLDGTVATFNDEGDGEGGSSDPVSVNANDLLPYSFTMGNAPRHFNGQKFAQLLHEKCPEIANYELEDYGGSDSYLSFNTDTLVDGNTYAFSFSVDDFNLILYKAGDNEVSVQIEQQVLPKTVYQFFYDIGEVTFSEENFQDKYRRSFEISKLEFWIEASYMYNIYFTAAEVKTFLYND